LDFPDLGVYIRGELAPLGDWLYFAATDGSATELYRIRWPRLFGDAFEDE
jgi:hypothetical protein